MGIALSKLQVAQFQLYHDEIIKWNVRANLISKRDESRILERHFLESSALVSCPKFRGHCSVLDLGTGAGFPGLPLKILRPELMVTLLDAKRWKVLFLNNIVANMKLTKVWVVNDRAESLADNRTYFRRFDVVVSRAVTDLIQLYRLSHPLLKKGGALISLRGSSLLAEWEKFSAAFPAADASIVDLRGRLTPLSDNMHIVTITERPTRD